MCLETTVLYVTMILCSRFQNRVLCTFSRGVSTENVGTVAMLLTYIRYLVQFSAVALIFLNANTSHRSFLSHRYLEMGHDYSLKVKGKVVPVHLT
jgi:hypothetical protein